MKVAARFPVKGSYLLIKAIILFHLLLLLLSWNMFSIAWQQWFVIPAILISAYFSNRHYQKITVSSDDLCWSGENWLMHQGSKFEGVFYLELLPTSWISKNFSLLHFNCAEQHYHWLFSRTALGDRMYSELVYLANQDLKSKAK